MTLNSQIYTAQFQTRRWLSGKYHQYRSLFRPKAELAAPPRKVLMVVAGLLGDSVMSIPAVAAVKQVWRDAHVTVLGKKHNAELLAACPFVDEFHVFQHDPFSLKHKAEIAALQKWLTEAKFDAAFILLGDQYAHLLANAAIPVRVGVAGDLQQACLTHTYEIGSPRTWGANERLDALRAVAGVTIENALPQLWVQDEVCRTGRQKLIDAGLQNFEDYAVLHPFGSTRRQWWSIEKAAELARAVRSEHRLETVLIGGQETTAAVPETIKNNFVDTTGKLTLPELLAVIDGAKCVITTDSGPFHIAGALGKPIVGLFRSRRPEHAAAYPTAQVVLGENEVCQSDCRWNFCRANPCRQLEQITTESVLETVNNLSATISV